ncbi:hypothetical protein GCM10029978_113830 [Actinoallomurus acanthiterrae]
MRTLALHARACYLLGGLNSISAVSGVYIAKLVRQDVTGEAGHMVFVVRDDTRHSDLLVQTSDATWQAYNSYGGNGVYAYGATSAFPTGTYQSTNYWVDVVYAGSS